MRGATNPLSLVYQPIVSTSDGSMKALEALTRVRLPMIGDVSPIRFVGLTETAHLSLFHTSWVLREACSLVSGWQYSHRPLSVSVNVSARNLGKPQLMTIVEKALRDSGLYPSNLQLEITETMLLQSSPVMRAQLTDLRQNGIRIAIDDFGTGFSSLRSILEIQADVVKLDRCFVRGLETSSKSLAVMRSAITMAHEMGMEVVAEGVETKRQRTILREVECDSIQGYLVSAPMKLDRLSALMEVRMRRSAAKSSDRSIIRRASAVQPCPATVLGDLRPSTAG